ncbi:MAG: cobalamin-dependent protein [Actinomycetota bacterium]|nr:cobalamin-dependent protein [Actinomycetota bacterium]MDH5225120.1 cobalamin-dependent protein [Actinomycetota bacterium]
MRAPRVLLAKPGLDGHDRGIKVIAMALRDAGAEVIYLGLRRSVPEIAQAAIEDDVDVVGISVLSGAHLPLAADLLQALDREGVVVPVVIGGTIPETDIGSLTELGVAAVFPVGTGLHEVVDGVLELAARERVER